MLKLGNDDRGAWLWVRVQPNARRAGFGTVVNERLKISLAAPAVDGKANRALVAFLAEALGVPASRVEIRRGETAREKVVGILSLTSAEVAAALARHGVSTG